MKFLRAGEITINLECVTYIHDRGYEIIVHMTDGMKYIFGAGDPTHEPIIAALRARLPGDVSAPSQGLVI